MRVILIASTSIVNHIPGYEPHKFFEADADELAEEAGRLCYESWNRPNPKTATNQGYIENINDKQHYSVEEHATATFYIDGVTRNLTHELIRHRHLSYSEVSQRYVDVGLFDFVEHPGLADIGPEARKDLAAAIEAGRKAYRSIVEDLTAKGKERKEARQAARHALVSGTETKIVVSGNMRAWRDVLWKRLSPAADAEIRQVAQAILVELKKIAPNIFQDF
jgi:thymidylate synthase (FAD)